ncbi:MAG: hypothetical protein ACYCZ0_01610 [Minisyncoccota bacterium]
MDAETSKIMTDAEEIRATTSGKGWELMKSKLDNRVLDLQNISNLDLSVPESISTQIMARRMASDLIYEWLKIDVYGAIEARDTNITHPTADEDFMDRK